MFSARLFFTANVIFAVLNADLISTQNVDVFGLNTTVEPAVVSQSCVTGKQVEGICVKRERCDYGTAAIDFTLYRPRGYKLSCQSADEVCCPSQFMVQHDRVWVPDNEGFDFDDDD